MKEAHQFVIHSMVDRQPVQHLQCRTDVVTPAQSHQQASNRVLGQLQSPECGGRLAYQRRVTVVDAGHHQGQHGLDTGVPVQETSDVAEMMKHGALDALDLAMHVHGGTHDDAEVAEGGHCTHADATNAQSRLQRLMGGLVVRSRDGHGLGLHLVVVDLELVGEQL